MDIDSTDVAVMALCAVYAGAVWVVDRTASSGPRDWLVQRAKELRGRIGAESWRAGEGAQRELEELEQRLAGRLVGVASSRVQAGWRYVHGLEDAHVLELDGAVVEEQLRTARTRLAGLPGAPAVDLVRRIDKALADQDGAQLERRRALLHEAKVHLHDRADTSYEGLATLSSKAVWLTFVSLALVAILAVSYDREAYFLFGAVGGLISRLSRVLPRRPRPSDYGAAWSTLFLSPAAGALAGWVGVMLVAALAADPFNVLDDGFGKPWSESESLLGVAVAFVFGFSERLFNRLLGVAEGQLEGKVIPKAGSAQKDGEDG